MTWTQRPSLTSGVGENFIYNIFSFKSIQAHLIAKSPERPKFEFKELNELRDLSMVETQMWKLKSTTTYAYHIYEI